MKNKIIAISLSTALAFSLAYEALAKDPQAIKQISAIFSKEYSGQDLLNILVNVESDVTRGDEDELRKRSKEVLDYLNYRKTQVALHDQKISETQSSYIGDRVIEIKYGKRFDSNNIILPLTINNSPISATLGANASLFAEFQDDEISEAKVKYISYDTGNQKAGEHLHRLSISLSRRNLKTIRDNLSDVYEDILVDHSQKASLVTKIRDNLAVAKLLLENDQTKAAKESVSTADALILRLIEIKSDSPKQQKTIRDLRKELEDVSKAADANYLSQWEKFPQEIEDWWNKK